MSKSGHGAIPQGIPGWYVQFQSDILLQLPRPEEISEEVALGWHNSRGAMKKTLREALLPPNKPTMEVQRQQSMVVVDGDADPLIPSGLGLKGKGAVHRRMGMVALEKRGDGALYANGVKVVRYTSRHQKGGNHIQGYELRRELEYKRVLSACFLDALLANPHLIPDGWKIGYTYFWGTVFSTMSTSSLCVKCLFWRRQWGWNYYWLGRQWLDYDPAAVLAS